MCSHGFGSKHSKNSSTLCGSSSVSGRGKRPEAEEKECSSGSVALEIVPASDAKPHYIWGLLCKVVVHIKHSSFPLWMSTCLCSGIFVFTRRPSTCPFIHSPGVHEAPDPGLSPGVAAVILGSTFAGLTAGGWEVHGQSASCGVMKTLHFPVHSSKERARI